MKSGLRWTLGRRIEVPRRALERKSQKPTAHPGKIASTCTLLSPILSEELSPIHFNLYKKMILRSPFGSVTTYPIVPAKFRRKHRIFLETLVG